MATRCIPQDGLIFWGGTHAAVGMGGLADYERETRCDGLYLQGVDSTYTGITSTANDGGSTTHTHTSNSHTHLVNSHTHAFTAASVVGPAQGFVSSTVSPFSGQNHSHASATTAGDATTWTSADPTLSSENITPWTVELIVLVPKAATTPGVPADCITYYDQATAPGNFTTADGGAHPLGGTTALVTTRMVCAPATGTDGGANSGTNGNHSHTQDGTGHNHAPTAAHDHGTNTAGASSGTKWADGVEAVLLRPVVHHSVATNSATSPDTDDNDDDTANSADWQAFPKSRLLLPIQNTSGVARPPVHGMVIGYRGAAAAIPNGDGWFLCDGANGTDDLTDHQIRGYQSAEGYGFGTEFGARIHSHSFAHGHTVPTHTHTAGTVTETGAVSSSSGSSRGGLGTGGHTHVWTIDAASAYANTATGLSTGTVDHRRPWRDIVWIWYDGGATVHLRGTAALKGTAALR